MVKYALRRDVRVVEEVSGTRQERVGASGRVIRFRSGLGMDFGTQSGFSAALVVTYLVEIASGSIIVGITPLVGIMKHNITCGADCQRSVRLKEKVKRDFVGKKGGIRQGEGGSLSLHLALRLGVETQSG